MKIFAKAFLISGMAVLAMACSSSSSQENMEQDEVAKVKTKRVYMRSVDQVETYTATIVAKTTNNIAPKLSLRIERIMAEVGDMVKKGQVLAILDQANLLQVRLQMQNDSIEFNRADELYKIGGTSKSVWDARKLAYNVSRSNYENLKQNTMLVSPINGFVTARNYDAGDMYSMGQPLYVVEQITPVKVMVNIPETLYSKIKKGMSVDVTLDVYGDEVFKGVISIVSPTIDQATRTFPVEISLPNTDLKLRPGMFARVTIAHGIEQRVVVPDMAVVKLSGAGTRFVYVVNGGKVTFQEVELGRRIDKEYEIISGLSDCDEVVVEGHGRLKNGMRVEVINSEDLFELNK